MDTMRTDSSFKIGKIKEDKGARATGRCRVKIFFSKPGI